jgi:hypothetical protein
MKTNASRSAPKAEYDQALAESSDSGNPSWAHQMAIVLKFSSP